MERGIILILSVVLAGCTTHDAGAPGNNTTTDAGATDTSTDDASSDDAATGSDVCSPPVATPQQLPGEVAQVISGCGSLDGGLPPLVGPLPSSTVLSFDIGLPLRNQSELNQLLAEISDPSSPEYQHYLTPDQFAAMFGPTVCDYDAVLAWAKAQGFTVTMTYSNRDLVDLSAPASSIEAAFHVTLDVYLRRDGTQFYAPDMDPSIDLTVPVLDALGLDNCDVPMPATGNDR